jgi:hypothetical protein
MGFVEFVGWCVIFYALLMLAFYEPGLTLMLILLSMLVGLMLLPFIVLGIALDKE